MGIATLAIAVVVVVQRAQKDSACPAFRTRDINSLAKLPQHSRVNIRGVVTYADDSSDFIYLQDTSGAIRVRWEGVRPRLHDCRHVRVRGTTSQSTGDLAGLAGMEIQNAEITCAESREALPRAVPAVLGDVRKNATPPVRVELQGIVRAATLENGRLNLVFSDGDAEVRASVAGAKALDPDQLFDARVRLRGVVGLRWDGNEKRTAVDQVWVTDIADIVIEQPRPSDPPPLDLRSLLVDPAAAGGHRVRMRGAVVESGDDGRTLITDGASAIVVYSDSNRRWEAGLQVEAVGFPTAMTHAICLRHATIAPQPAPDRVPAGVSGSRGSPSANVTTLHSVSGIRLLSAQQAQLAYPLKIQGVITYSEPFYQYFFVQDSTAGIFVDAQGQDHLPKVGDLVALDGLTGPGFFAPIIRHPYVRVLRAGDLPRPVHLSAELAESGGEDSQWVEITGFVHPITRDNSGASFMLYSPLGLVHVNTPRSTDANYLESLVDRSVTLRGPFGGIFNQKRQIIGYQMFLPGKRYIRATGPVPVALEQSPVLPIADVRRFSQHKSGFQRRVRVRGVIIFSRPDHYAYMQDASGGVEIQLGSSSPAVGNFIEAIGYPASGDYSPVLRDAVFRVLATNVEVSPRQITPELALGGSVDNQLIEIRALLLSLVHGSQGKTLVLQAGTRIFSAQLDRAPLEDSLENLHEGSLLNLRGVCSVQTDTRNLDPIYGREPTGFEVLLRSPKDVVILQQPPWWTLKKALALLGLLSAFTGVALVWVYSLRRRVRAQTAELRTAKEAAEGTADALQNAYSRMEFEATHDKLTGLLNRPAVLDRLNTEIARAQREHTNLSILLIDIDHFKQINDSYGHLQGDVVLREVAQRMATCLRPYDHIGRYGGEEFLVVVPTSSAETARAVGERLRSTLANSRVRGALRITVSVGFVTAPDLVDFEEQKMLSLADSALYAAKARGRNRVEGAGESVINSS